MNEISIKDMVYDRAKHYKNIKESADKGELNAIVSFVERASEDMIDGMLDMLDDGIIIGRRER